jgi:hypothetical protein
MGGWNYDAKQQGYSPALADRICAALAEGRSLGSICKDKGMPTEQTTYRWLAKSAEFQARYALARRLQAEALLDEILDIADDARNDWIEKNGRWVANSENIRRAKARIDVRKWRAGILAPRKYRTGPARSGEAMPVTKVVREIVVAGKQEDGLQPWR